MAQSLLSGAAASALRRMAANDDPALLRVFARFRSKEPALLSQRLLDLVPAVPAQEL